MKPYVLDSSAVLAYLYDEDGAHRVEKLFRTAAQGGTDLAIGTVNWAEVAHVVRRREGAGAWSRARAILDRIPMERTAPDAMLAEEAAALKGRYTMSLADAFAAALALSRNARLVTSDPEFRPLARHLPILWVR